MTRARTSWCVAALVLTTTLVGVAQTSGMSNREWQAWVDDVRPFFLASEAAAAKNVPAADRSAFRDEFWKRRTDATAEAGTAVRATLEARIRAADKRYRVNDKGAWNDCGRTYVLLGTPDWVRSMVLGAHFNGGDAAANFRDQDDQLAEVWIYRAHPRLPPSPNGVSFGFTTKCEAIGSPQFQRLLDQAAASYLVAAAR
ncbi:MAG: GWxTD domain-containing protein [Acidobacteria bacterium]|nr:GWxTD domain-containing protein [Acidobacteriota bacterium]